MSESAHDGTNVSEDEWFDPNGGTWADVDEDNGPDYTAIFDAPDYSSFVKQPVSTTAKHYQTRVKSLLKACMMWSISKGNLPDAAAIIDQGPATAAALGLLADKSDGTRKFLDLLTAPENPYVVAVLTLAPFVAQLLRNHESTVRQLPELRKASRAERKAYRAQQASTPPRFTIKLPFVRKAIPIRFKLRINPFAGFTAQTQHPSALVVQIFSDENLQKELAKQGIRIRFGQGGQ